MEIHLRVRLGLLGLALLARLGGRALVGALFVTVRWPAIAVVATTTSARSTTATTTTTTTASASTTSPCTTAVAAASLVPAASIVPVVVVATAAVASWGVWTDASLLDVLDFVIDVLLLALDLEFLVLELWLWVQLEEILRFVLCGKLDKDAALEVAVGLAAQTDGVDGAVDGEELFNVELCRLGLLAEALGVDAAGHGLVLVDLAVLVNVVGEFVRKRDLARDAAVVGNVEHGRGLDGVDDCRVWLEVAHALEVVDDLEVDGGVAVASGLLEEVLVGREVGVAEVELDLAADLVGVAGLGKFADIKLGLVVELLALLVGVFGRLRVVLGLFGLLLLGVGSSSLVVW